MGIGALRRHHGAPKIPEIGPKPEASAVKAEWKAYAESLGLDGSGTKAEIIETVEKGIASLPAGQGVTTSKDLAPDAGNGEGADPATEDAPPTEGEQTGTDPDESGK